MKIGIVNLVNCWNPEMGISSRAALAEGSQTNLSKIKANHCVEQILSGLNAEGDKDEQGRTWNYGRNDFRGWMSQCEANKRNHTLYQIGDENRTFLSTNRLSKLQGRACEKNTRWKTYGVNLQSRYPQAGENLPYVRIFQKSQVLQGTKENNAQRGEKVFFITGAGNVNSARDSYLVYGRRQCWQESQQIERDFFSLFDNFYILYGNRSAKYMRFISRKLWNKIQNRIRESKAFAYSQSEYERNSSVCRFNPSIYSPIHGVQNFPCSRFERTRAPDNLILKVDDIVGYRKKKELRVEDKEPRYKHIVRGLVLILPSLNWVNCKNAEMPTCSQPCQSMVTSSTNYHSRQVGSTTTRVSLNNNPWHERPAFLGKNDDIVSSCRNKGTASDRIKSLSIRPKKEIKAFGDTVIIRTVPNIDIKDYYKGMKLVYDVYESEKVTLKIDKGKYWAFGVDDVDKRQSDLPYVDKWSDDASQQMKIKIDTGILADIYADVASANKGAQAGASSASYNIGTSGSAVAITKANVIDYIVDCEAVLTEQNLPETDRWMVIPTWMNNLLEKSDLKDASMTGKESTLPNGRIGRLGNFEILVSNNYTAVTDTYQCYHVLFGHKSALTFAAQITESESLKNPDSFGDLIRGLNVFGYETIKPSSMGDLYCRKG